MTTPGKNAPGLKGFPTPNTAADIASYLLFLFPDPTWAQYILGACEPLSSDYNWYEAGDLLPEEASEAFRLIVQQAPYNMTDTNVQAPFWDSENGSDADDELPPDDQPWFGFWDGETFIESISYWAVTAFLATGIGEGAAIEFITPLRTFRLQMKRNEHGGKLLILMDSNIFQLIDLFNPTEDVVSVDIASPGSTLQLRVTGEHNPDATPDSDGNYPCSIIKKELSEAEVSPPNQRINTETNVFQITPDGGTTWIDAECSDPRTAPQYMLPAPEPYEGIECDVAARMTAQFKATLDIFIASGDAAQFATGVMAVFAATVPFVGWLVDLLILAGNALVDIGQANIEAAFTTEVYDAMQCAFFCFVDHDGRVTQQQLDHAYDNLSAAYPGTVANVIAELRLLYGDNAMVNAGVVRTETGTCDDCLCTWCYEWESVAELVAEGFTNSIHDAHSDFWEASFGVELTKASFTYDFNGTGGAGDSAAAIWKSPGYANRILLVAPLGGAPNPIEWTGDEIATGISFGLNVATGSGGLCAVTGLHLEGLGSRPAWTHGHEC